MTVATSGDSTLGRRSRGWLLGWAVAAALLMAVSLELALLLLRSLDWPLVQDAPLMNYMAWRLDQGDAPYRDMLDMNFPGAYAVHWGAIRVFGTGDWGWRLFDLSWLGLTMGAMVLCCRRFGWLAALAGALLLAVFHVENGPLRTGQREFVMVAPLLLSWHLVAAYAERGGWGRLLAAGLLAGFAVTIKPVALLFWIGLCAATCVFARRAGRSLWRPVLAIGLGGVAPLTAAAAWVMAAGGWQGFSEVLTQLLPLYSSIRRVTRLDMAAGVFTDRFVVALSVVAAVVFARLLLSGRRVGARVGLLLMGVAYGLVHYLIQGKGWQYHLYVFVAFLCAACGAESVPPRPQREQEQEPPACRASNRPPLAACVALAAAALTAGHALLVDRDFDLPQKNLQMAVLVNDIASRVGPGDTVQVMDTTYGGLDALLRLKLRQPTRFIYDFAFFMDPDLPYVQTLRKQFIEELRSGRPRLVVVFRDAGGWPGKGYGRLKAFEELRQFLDEQYLPPYHGPDYQVHVRKDPPRP